MSLRAACQSSVKAAGDGLRFVSAPLRRIWPRSGEAAMGLVALLIIGVGLLTYSSTVAESASSWFGGSKVGALVDGMFNPMRSRHSLMQPDVPLYDLKIGKSDLRAIEEQIAKAKKQGWMSDEMKLWVNAKLFYQGEKYDVKARVRGDLPNHWEGPKRSWAIRFSRQKLDDRGKTIDEPILLQENRELAKRRINLIIPIDREFAVAPFINKVMHERGLVTTRDRFAVLRLNGIVQGVYYDVEDFDNSLLASQRRPETPIFGQNNRPMHFEQYTKLGIAGAADVKYDMGSVRRDVEPLNDLGMRAMQILFDFCNRPTPEGFKQARAVLDWNKYLQFRSLTTLLNTNHVRFGSDNFKLFYDASRGLLEPIPWDAHLVKLPREPGTIDFWNNKGPDELQRATLQDPQLRLERNTVLWDMVGDGGKNMLAAYKEIHDQVRPLAWNDVLVTPIQAHKMDELKAVLEHNVARVHKVLSTSCGNLVYRLDANDRATIDLSCSNFSGLTYSGIEITDKLVFSGDYRLVTDANENGTLDDGDPTLATATAKKGVVSFAINESVLPQVKYGADTIDGRYWEYMDTLSGRKRYFLVGKLTPDKRHPLDWIAPTIKALAANAVSGAKVPSAPVDALEAVPSQSIGVVTYDASDPFDIVAPERTLAEFLAAYPQFQASSDKPGAAELTSSATFTSLVIVPKSVPLVLKPGAEIVLAPGVSMLCYGGLTAVGTAEAPIRIRAADNAEPFGTFACVRPTERQVVLRHVDVQGGGQAQVNGMLFTGGLAIYNGDLEMVDCHIHDMMSEDGVNLKNGRMHMERCLVARTDSDALDLDFCTGEVLDSRFTQVKGDGVDLSGSRVLVAGNFFDGLGDKGTSVGEESYPILLNNLYLNCNIGVSCKDLSHPKIAHCTFVGNKTAIEGKRKKEMFGGASGEFVRCVFLENKTFLAEDYFTQGRIDVHDSLIDVESRFTTCHMAKAQFVAPAAGDYRLLADSLPASLLDAVLPEWAHAAGQSASELKGPPGVLHIQGSGTSAEAAN